MGMISARVDNFAVVWFVLPNPTAQQARTLSIGLVETVGNIMKPHNGNHCGEVTDYAQASDLDG
jgi:hypothetical protein